MQQFATKKQKSPDQFPDQGFANLPDSEGKLHTFRHSCSKGVMRECNPYKA